jgi:3-hydroxyisobutyrate dehydrogenase
MGRVGFIGLGHMGGALAARLAPQTDLYVLDLDPARVAAACAAGAHAAGSVPEIAAKCSLVITCLPTSAHVQQIVNGDGGLGLTLAPGSLVIDCTTGEPAVTRELAAALGARGIGFIDAPVSGGPQAAAAGTIAIIVGGAGNWYEQALPTLSLISPNVRHVGPAGAGHVVKLLNNVLAAGHRLLAFEMAAVAAAQGVDPETFVDVVNLGSGRSYATEVTMPRHVFGEALGQGFSLGLMAKDVGLGCQLLPDQLEGLSLALEVHQRLLAALTVFGPDADINQTIETYERAAHATVATSLRPGLRLP